MGTGNSTLFEKTAIQPVQRTVYSAQVENRASEDCVLRPVAYVPYRTYCKRSRCLPPAARPRWSSCSCRTGTRIGYWVVVVSSVVCVHGREPRNPSTLLDGSTAYGPMFDAAAAAALHACFAARRTRTCIVASFSAWRQCRHASPCTPRASCSQTSQFNRTSGSAGRGTGSLVADDD